MTWEENNKKHRLDRREERNNKVNKTVNKFMPNGDFIESYHSTRQAERETGVDNSSISRCCNGKSLTAGGYVWKYNENAEELIAANLAEEIVG